MRNRLPVLNFPRYGLRLKELSNGGIEIFDRCRKSFVALTPEEWVRQHLINFLILEKGFPESLMVPEKSLKLNNTVKRADVLVYDKFLNPLLIAECKEASVPLSQEVLDQALRYNLIFNVKYLVLTNGLSHYVCKMVDGKVELLNTIPDYQEL
jgi:hypothetical protein